MPSNKPQTVIIGKGDIAVNCLLHLAEIKELPVLIICDKADTGEDTWHKSLLRCARALGYIEGENVVVEAKPNRPEFVAFLRSFKPDVIFSLQPRTIFRQPFIDSARAVINLHFAPLPALRGVAPCSWAITDGLDTMGATLHLITQKGVDVDPLVAQKLFPIETNDTAWTLFQKATANGTALFRDRYRELVAHDYTIVPQDESKATYHPAGEFRFDLLEPDLHADATEVDRFIRSRIFPPLQLPFISYEGKKLAIEQAHLLESSSVNSEPRIVHKVADDWILYCNKGIVAVKTSH